MYSNAPLYLQRRHAAIIYGPTQGARIYDLRLFTPKNKSRCSNTVYSKRYSAHAMDERIVRFHAQKQYYIT